MSQELWDWDILEGCFTNKNISPTDLDCGLYQGLTEVHGNFLFIECKRPGVDVTTGQSILHRKLINTGRFNIIILWGLAKEKSITKIMLMKSDRDIQVFEREEASIDLLREIVSNWDHWAYTRKIDEEGLDDIEYFLERSAIFEYDAGYSREEADTEARKMMIERRLRLEGIDKAVDSVKANWNG